MKYGRVCALALLFFAAVFPLSAQAQDGILIYVPPVDGIGSAPEDNELFNDLITNELQAWNFTVAEEPDEAAYFLIGTLASSENVENKFLLSLALQDKDGAILQEQGLIYTTPDEANSMVPTLLYNIFSNVFDLNTYHPVEEPEPVEEDPWRRQEWYLGLGVFWSPHWYYGDRLAVSRSNFAAGLSAEYHFVRFAAGKLFWLRLLSVETGLEVAGEYIAASTRPGDEYNNVILQIPLFIQYVWRPGLSFMHKPYAGILFNIPLFPDTTPALLSWATGFKFGMKAGPGIAYADVRYSMDVKPSGLHKNNPLDKRKYQRYMLYLGVGFKYNLVDRIATAIKTHRAKKQPAQTTFLEDVIEVEEMVIEPEDVVTEAEEPALPEEATPPEEEIIEIEKEVTQLEEEPVLPEEIIEIEEEVTQLEEEPVLPEEIIEIEEEAAQLEEDVTPSENIADNDEGVEE